MINKIKEFILKWVGKILPVASDIFVAVGSVTLGVGIGSFIMGGIGVGQMVIGLSFYLFGRSLHHIFLRLSYYGWLDWRGEFNPMVGEEPI